MYKSREYYSAIATIWLILTILSLLLTGISVWCILISFACFGVSTQYQNFYYAAKRKEIITDADMDRPE